jgi:DNA-binding MarR family transcriptional regulator
MPPNPTRHLGFLISSVTRLYVRLFERHSIELGLSLMQCKALSFLSRNEGASQARLAEHTETDPMMMVRILDRMESDGWIERRENPGDRRAYQLFLREAAKPILERIRTIAQRTEDEVLADFSAAEREQLTALLDRALARLLTVDAAAARPAHHGPTSAADKPGRRTALQRP